MLQIAICDDTPSDLNAALSHINEYLESKHIDAELNQYTHPDALLSACETRQFHVYILDIVMPMIDGVTLGREIRRLDAHAQIIFATTEPGFALESFGANPINYLLKPLDKQKLFATLDLAVSKLKISDGSVTVKTKIGLQTVAMSSILCCEYTRHIVRYTLASGEKLETTSITGSFAEHILPILQDRRFIQPHNAFAVNMSQVERMSKEGFALTGGVRVPISAKQYAAVRKAYLDYRLSREVK